MDFARRFLFLLGVALPLPGAPDWNTLLRGMVKVEAEKQPKDTGAGIVISASADSIRVLTAAHVVARATNFEVYFYSNAEPARPVAGAPRVGETRVNAKDGLTWFDLVVRG